LEDVTVLVTGAGAPGIAGTVHSLGDNFDRRKVRILGTDVAEDVVGRYMVDSLRWIPWASSEEYLDSLMEICLEESVDVILPQNTAELLKLSEAKGRFLEMGVGVAVSDPRAIGIANDKERLCALADSLGVPIPASFPVTRFDRLRDRAQKLGWPEKKVVVKPPESNGMRGFRVIDESIDLRRNFYHEKPSSVLVRMDDLERVLGEEFPTLLVMEHLPGQEYTVDVLRSEGTVVVPRTRDSIRTGITFSGTVERNEDIIRFSGKLAEEGDLRYAFGFQFKRDGKGVPKLLESNPRVQGTMVLSTLAGANIIYGAVKHSLGEEIPDFEIAWGTRLLRYWDGIGVLGNVSVGNI